MSMFDGVGHFHKSFGVNNEYVDAHPSETDLMTFCHAEFCHAEAGVCKPLSTQSTERSSNALFAGDVSTSSPARVTYSWIQPTLRPPAVFSLVQRIVDVYLIGDARVVKAQLHVPTDVLRGVVHGNGEMHRGHVVQHHIARLRLES